MRGERGRRWRRLVPPGMGGPAGYGRARLVRDLVAGVTVGAVAVPAGLAMSELAGLPPMAGVYATLLPLAVYALLGSSRHLVVGPESVLAALTLSIVAPLAQGDPGRYAVLAAALALMTGTVYIAAGLLRLGFMADFLSKPVLLGFVNGTALIIIAGQLGKVFGIPVAFSGFFPTLWRLAAGIGRTHPPTLVLSALLLGLALALRRWAPVLPATLAVVAAATAASALLDLEDLGVAVVGPVDGGLPPVALPWAALPDLADLVVPALGLALVGFADAAAISRGYARRSGYPIDPNRELTALGAANLSAGLTQAFPVGSSASRTALGVSTGASSQVTGVTAAAVVALLAALAMPLLRPLPTAALGVVIIAASLSLLDAASLLRLRRAGDAEAALAVCAFAAVLALGVLPGVGVAVLLSLGVFVYRAVRPHDAVLGTAEGIDGYRDVSVHGADTHEGLIVYRFDAPLFFANAPYFAARARGLVDGADGPVRFLLVNMEAVTHVDATAADMLRDLRSELAAHGTALALARTKAPVRAVLERTGLLDEIGRDRMFWSVRSGVRALLAEPPPHTGPPEGAGD
ncbi:sulfate permease [Nocardiopsis sp. CNT-189]|uniref:SulP family inorganic anion transporter n=1 Tax=Nocardiopsis oceanisediminis TaxID=2816862 RepID=UPI003B2EB180